MKSKKYYAIKKGRKPGIYETWKEAEEQVKDFPNAEYKKFNSEEANDFLKESNNNENKFNLNEKNKNFKAIAYVDGSFNEKEKSFTYGLLFICNNKKLEFFEKFQDNKWSNMRNVAGEIMGAIKAMQVSSF